MRNVHKRIKQQRKVEREKQRIVSEAMDKVMIDLLYFLRKHPDQANYELKRIQDDNH